MGWRKGGMSDGWLGEDGRWMEYERELRERERERKGTEKRREWERRMLAYVSVL